MIISCEKCNKKFEISDNLIPNEGRLLQCGSCSHQWHFTPVDTIKLTNEVRTTEKGTITSNIQKNKKSKKINKIYNDENKFSEDNIQKDLKNKKSVGHLSYLLVAIISFIALILLLDTFRIHISSFVPNLDFYLSSLYESLRDIFLFFKDLLK